MKSSPIPMSRIVAVVVAVPIAFVCGAASADTPPPQSVLSLSVSASIEVPQDVLVVAFAANRDGADAASVQGALKQALDAALAEARQAARPGQVEVQTGNFSVYPRYANANSNASSVRQGIVGWQGSAELIVEGRDTAAIGQLTSRITTMSIARVGFRLSREASAKVEADVAAQAIERYRSKATEYAKQFGYSGYSIREVNVSINEPAGFRPMPASVMRAAAPSAEPPLSVEAGKATVTANVSGSVQMK